MQISFLIETSKNEKLLQCIDSIKKLNINSNDYEIIVQKEHISGPNVILCPAQDGDDFLAVRDRMASIAKFENLVFCSDNMIFDSNWYSAWLNFKQQWNVATNCILNPNNKRYWDWSIKDERGHCNVQYDFEDDGGIYISDLYIIKKSIWQQCQWSEVRSLNESAKNVAYSKLLHEKLNIKFIFNKDAIVRLQQFMYHPVKKNIQSKDSNLKVIVDINTQNFQKTINQFAQQSVITNINAQKNIEVLNNTISANIECINTKLENIIVMTLCNRPDYTKQVLTALAKCCNIQNYKLIFCIEPINDEVINIAKVFNACKTQIIINPYQYGNPLNTYKALEEGFKYSDFVILLEDDTVPAQDCLLYFEYCKNRYANDKTIYTIGAYYYNDINDKNHKEYYNIIVRKQSAFLWGWGTWKDRWEERNGMKNDWDFDGSKSRFWDYHLDKLRGNRVQMLPKISRTKNIGIYGGMHSCNDVDAFNKVMAKITAVDLDICYDNFTEYSNIKIIAPYQNIPRVHECLDKWDKNILVLGCFKEDINNFTTNYDRIILQQSSQDIIQTDKKKFLLNEMLAKLIEQYPNENIYGLSNSDVLPLNNFLENTENEKALIYHRMEVKSWEQIEGPYWWPGEDIFIFKDKDVILKFLNLNIKLIVGAPHWDTWLARWLILKYNAKHIYDKVIHVSHSLNYQFNEPDAKYNFDVLCKSKDIQEYLDNPDIDKEYKTTKKQQAKI